VGKTIIQPKVEIEEQAIAGVLFHREGDIVYVASNRTVSMNAGVYTYLCEVPTEFRPRAARFVYCVSGNSADVRCLLRVQTNGQVDVYSSATVSNSTLFLSGSYII
jgi:hypothetical protein